MGRTRNIKPGFLTNEELPECGVYAHLLFAGLWTIADKEGRFEDRPKRIKTQCLPYYDVDVDSLLQSLHDHGFIVRYQIDGARYCQITNWHKHQNPHHKEAESDIPPVVVKHGSSMSQEHVNNDASLPQAPVKGSEECKVKECKEEGSKVKASSAEQVLSVFGHYRKHHPRSFKSPQRTSKEWKLIEARLKEGFSVEDLCTAIEGNHVSPHHCGQNETQTEYHDLELIVRNGSKVSGFIQAANRKTGPPAKASRIQTREERSNWNPTDGGIDGLQ